MENYYKCYQWLTLMVFALVVFQTKADEGVLEAPPPSIVPEKALAMGAVCLDGSLPNYLWKKADAENKDNWLLYFEGGGWCSSIEECKTRTGDNRGSAKNAPPFGWKGILYSDQKLNPTVFRSWNKVAIRYCDQSSFTGDVEQPVDNLYFRGKRILDVTIDELLNKQGMKNAKQVFLTGGSAGGVSVALHCQRFRDALPSTTKFKCLMDGGYFIHTKDPKLAQPFDTMFGGMVALHNSTANLPDACPYKNVKGKEHLCMHPQYVVPHIEAPIFIMHTPYDAFQMGVTLAPQYTIAHNAWTNGTSLAMSTYKILQDFRLEALDAIKLSNKPANALYISDCFGHTQLTFYYNMKGFAVNNLTDVDAISNWFFDRREVKEIDQSVLLKDCLNDVYIPESIKRLM